jgi:excisionase family DNA binding protein
MMPQPSKPRPTPPARTQAQRAGLARSTGPPQPPDRASGATTRSASFERPFTVAEAARVLGTSQEGVRRLLREGRIEHERISPRRTVIRESALRAYLESVRVGRRP